MPRVRQLTAIVLSALCLAAAGCSNTKSPEATPAADPAPAPPPPVAESAATSAVSAEDGGEGFTGEGWLTNNTFTPVGDRRAVKGGLYRELVANVFPASLRMAGPDASTSVNYLTGEALYETLITQDPNTLDYMPMLATHWQISKDKLEFRFRINPNARFSNGEPVTADDVVASWVFITDKTLRDPSRNEQFGRVQKPVAESRYIVSVKASKPDWRDLKDFGTALLIYPASSLKNLTGAQYLEKYNFSYLPGSGPYSVSPSDVQKGKSITLRRRKDYWGEKERRNVGMNNFDEVRLMIINDPQLSFETFKKGDLDGYWVNVTSWWLNETKGDAFERGLIQKRKIYNYLPATLSAIAINTRRAPFDDLRVRKALNLLFDRQKVIEQLYFNEYVPLNTYFPGTMYGNSSNPKNLYDPQEGLRLLAEAGWKDRDSEGRLLKNGKPFVVQLSFPAAVERPVTVFQQDMRKVGITVELSPGTAEAVNQATRRERQFDLAYRGTSGPVNPDPEQDYHPRLADLKDNNNVTGFKDPRMTELMTKYAASFDIKERIEIIHQLDLVMANQYHNILLWVPPAVRFAYWNKFGQPPGYFNRVGTWFGSLLVGPGPERMWWVDPVKEQQLRKAEADPSVKLEIGPLEDKHWLSYKEVPKPK